MDFTDLINSIKEAVSPGSSAIRTAPGQTYGPSMSIQGHVPINYRHLNGRESGEYQTYFTKPANPLSKAAPTMTQQITIDPTSTDFNTTYGGNVNPVIQHEVAHSILEKPGNVDYDKLAATNPAYARVLSQLSGRVVNPSEVPAYMSEGGAAQRWGVPQNIVDVYRQNMVQGLDPAVAQAYASNLGK